MSNNYSPQKRYNKTENFILKFITKEDKILDLGVENPFSQRLRDKGYSVENTEKADLDLQPDIVEKHEVDVVTALEILEHLVSPFPVLKKMPGQKLIATIPLKLWFSNAYKNIDDPFDCHFHEFEDWQFDWLLEKSGWKIIYKEKWISSSKKIGVRPFLRRITPRYYAVYAERQ